MPNPRMGMSQMPQEPMMEGPEGPSTTLSALSYPALKGVQPGATVSGSFTGKVQSVEGEMVTIGYEDIQLETENRADKELKKLNGPEMAAPEADGEDERF